MKNLEFKAVENSKNTSGEGGNNPAGGSGQLTSAQVTQLVNLAAAMGCTHFQTHLFMDTDAQMSSNYSSYATNYNLRNLYADTQLWSDAIHAAGMKHVLRGTWSAVKGNNEFAMVPYGATDFVPLGTVAGAAAEGETTYCGKMYRFLNTNVGASHFVSGDILAPISECTEYLAHATGAATISIASPAVVAKSSHGYSANETCQFSTTGALPTGVTAGTTYWVISTGLTSGQFQISLTKGGAAINTSGTQSGTHSLIDKYTWFDTSAGTQTGLYDFFTKMKAVVDAFATANGKSLDFMTIVNYSEYSSGYLSNSLPTATNHIAIDYYGHSGGYSQGDHAEPEHYVTDWEAVRTQVGGAGFPLFQTELGGILGNSWPRITGASSANTRRISSYEDCVLYQMQLYRAYRDSLVDLGLMNGVSNWGFWSGQNSSIVKYSGGEYSLNYFGQIYKNFIKGNGMSRIPVPQSGSFHSDAWGGRDISF